MLVPEYRILMPDVVHALCKKHNVLLIATRYSCAMLACEHDGVRPDVVLIDRILSGGRVFFPRPRPSLSLRVFLLMTHPHRVS
ncbi:hypothetical protein FB451DRAFT_1396889 [Mycena latifolia]|nr:hypothetical protein FB451DRAFT_1396889 [Mycena latifolia]